MKPRKILIVSDSFRLHTGFANVGRHIADHFYYKARNEDGRGKYQVVYLGWYDTPHAPEKRPYKLYSTTRDKKGYPVPGDKWGQMTMEKTINEEKPDIVLAIGDTWMVEHINHLPNRKAFKFVFYMAIDGEPTPENMIAEEGGRLRKIDWKAVATSADHVVAFGPFGMKCINNMTGDTTCKIHVPHGADTNVFRPAKDDDEKMRLRKQHFPMLNEDAFLVGFFSRNQPRKAIDKLIHAMSIMQHEHEVPERPIYLYMHCAFEDKTGWNIPGLTKYYKFKSSKVLRDETINVGAGIPDEHMRGRYACCDITALPTRGEGWGLTILESMACGVPVITTKYSAHADYCGPGSMFVKAASMVSEPITNIRRYVISVNDFVDKIKKAYNNENNILEKLSIGGRKQALNFDWAKVCEKWEEFMDTVDTSDLDKSITLTTKKEEPTLEAVEI